MVPVILLIVIGAVLLWQYNKRRVSRNIAKVCSEATRGLGAEIARAERDLGPAFVEAIIKPEAMAYLIGFIVQLCSRNHVTTNQDIAAFAVLQRLFPKREGEVWGAFRRAITNRKDLVPYETILQEGADDADQVLRTGRGVRRYYSRLVPTENDRRSRSVRRIRPQAQQQVDVELVHTIFDRPNQLIQFFVSKHEVRVASPHGHCVAVFKKDTEQFWSYTLTYHDGRYISYHLIPFRPAKDNFELFQKGCREVARRLQTYVVTGDLGRVPKSPPAFGALTVKTSDSLNDFGNTSPQPDISPSASTIAGPDSQSRRSDEPEMALFNRLVQDQSDDFVIDGSTECIRGQLNRAFTSLRAQSRSVSASAINDALADPWALGYMFGVIDCHTQIMGMDADARSMALMTTVFIQAFNAESAPGLLREMLNGQSHPAFQRGSSIGGEEVLALHRNKVQPTQLTAFITNQLAA
jgi:hypothetical protein